VLDRVEIERETLLVTRGGRPIATLGPLSSRPIDQANPLVVVLSPLEEKMLLRADERAPHGIASFEDIGEWQAVSNALSTLELDGLLERDFAGYRITGQGRLVAAILLARDRAD